MKPSERRALEAEKRARQAAEWREKELEKKAKKEAKREGRVYQSPKQEPADTERIDTTATYTKLPEGEIEVKGDGYHRESFFSNHIRLIAFIITAVVVLFVIGPLGYDIYLNVTDYLEDGAEVEGKVMTEADLLALAEKGKNLTWQELEAYEHTSMNNGKTMEIGVGKTNLTLRAERAEKNAFPDIVRLIHYSSGTYLDDIRFAKPGEIERFIASPGEEDVKDGEFDGKAMTESALLSLVGKGEELTWKELEAYGRTISDGGKTMEIKIAGTDLFLRVRKGSPLSPIRLIHSGCNEYIDDIQNAKKEDVNRFISTHASEEEAETK